MTVKVTTSDDKTAHFHDTMPVIKDGGVLHVMNADGSSVYFSPGYWQKAEVDADESSVGDSIR